MSADFEKGYRTKMGYPPVIQPIFIERGIFEEPTNRYQLYRHLVDTDDTLFGGIHTAAVLVQRCLQGFTVKAGEQQDDAEKRLYDELEVFYKSVLAPLEYDIAWKMYLDGTAVFALQKSSGVDSLEYLPMTHLTCVAKKEDIAKLEWMKENKVPKKIWKKKRIQLEELRPYLYTTQVLKRGYFVINELVSDKRQEWKATDCAVFDWGRKEEVIDLLGRYTLGVWNKSPLRALRAKILWKHSLIIGDMQYRRKNYPREHHKLPMEAFDPELFEGDTYEERLAAADTAAIAHLRKYAETVIAKDKEYRQQPDQGYVTFKDVEISVVESKTPYSSPNEMLDQIDHSIPAVTGVPRSAITGAPTGRASFASEVQIGAYLAIKAEYVAWRISRMFIWIAKEHIKNKLENTTDDELKKLKLEDHLDKISFKLSRVLERHQLVRDAAIMYEMPFTDDEIRAILDFGPLTDVDRKEVDKRREIMKRRHVESPEEAAATGKRRDAATRRPLTPESEDQQQIT